jgi:hypothetical protein
MLPQEIWLLIIGFLDETTRAIFMLVCREFAGLVLVATRNVIPHIYTEDVICTVPLLEWYLKYNVRKHHCINKKMYDNIALGGFLEVFQWIKSKYPVRFICDELTCTQAAKGGHLDMLQYLFEIVKCRWNAMTCVYAALNGHFEVLKYAIENGCPMTEQVSAAASHGGHLTILQYLHEHNCPWDEWTCRQAARGGYLTILQYAHENGCPWDVWTCAFAASGGHLAALKYARENGCPWNRRTLTNAREGNHLDILEYATTNGCHM